MTQTKIASVQAARDYLVEVSRQNEENERVYREALAASDLAYEKWRVTVDEVNHARRDIADAVLAEAGLRVPDRL